MIGYILWFVVWYMVIGILMTMFLQIHDQKRHFTHHINPAKTRLELQRIKYAHLSIEHRNIA